MRGWGGAGWAVCENRGAVQRSAAKIVSAVFAFRGLLMPAMLSGMQGRRKCEFQHDSTQPEIVLTMFSTQIYGLHGQVFLRRDGFSHLLFRSTSS